jgi:acyl-CoA thioester hydrolase
MSVHRHRGVVAFHETDASGRYHYTNALKWAENAEHALYRAAGQPINRFPRRAVHASFERPFADGDAYEVELEVEKLGTTSITYTWKILKAGQVAVTGGHTVVHIDEAGDPSPLPDALRTALKSHLRP